MTELSITFGGELGILSLFQGWKETILVSKTEGQSSVGQVHSITCTLSSCQRGVMDMARKSKSSA